MSLKASQIPAFAAAAGWVAGIVLFVASAAWPWALAAAIIGLSLLLARRHHLAFGLICIALGWLDAAINEPSPAPAPLIDGRESVCSAVITDIDAAPDLHKVVLRIDSAAGRPCPSFSALVSLLPGAPMRVGDRVHADLTLSPALVWDDLPGENLTDFRRRGIVATAMIGSDALTPIGHEPSLAASLYSWRQKLLSCLAYSGVGDNTFAVLAAILLGYDDELPTDLRDNFRAAGVAHVLALSGLHVGVIIMLLSLVLIPLRTSLRLRPWRFALTILLLWVYAALTGFPVSVVRAVIMATVLLTGKIIGRAATPFNSLCVAVLIIAAVNPWSIYSAGFQLSVAAVAGILLFGPALNPFTRKNRYLRAIVGALTIPVAATLGTLPVTLAHFHALPLLFMFANAVFALLMPVWMISGILVLVAPCAPLVAFADSVTAFASMLTDALASVPGSMLSGIYLSDSVILLIAAAIATLAWAINSGRRRAVLPAALGITAIVCLAPWHSVAEPTPDVQFARRPGTTLLLLRNGPVAVVVHTSGSRGHSGVVRHHSHALSGYAAVNACDTILFPAGDFARGPFSRRSDVLSVNNVRIAIPSHTRDSIGRVDYLLIGKRFRGNIAKLADICMPDTILLGSELSQARAREIAKSLGQLAPIIDLKTTLPGGL